MTSLTIAFALFVLVVLASFVASLRLAHGRDLAAADDEALAAGEGFGEPLVDESAAFDAVPGAAGGYDHWSDVVHAAAEQGEFADDPTAAAGADDGPAAPLTDADEFEAHVVLTLPAPAGDDGQADAPQHRHQQQPIQAEAA